MNRKIVKFSLIETMYAEDVQGILKIGELVEDSFREHGFTEITFAGESYYISEESAGISDVEDVIEAIRIQLPDQRIHLHELTIWDLNPVISRTFSPEK